MKINIFGFLKNNENWPEAKRVLHQLWYFNQTGPCLPAFCDWDFNQAYKRIRKKYTYKEVAKQLNL